MDEIKVPLVINKLQSKNVYDYLASKGQIGLNELYLIQNDGDLNVTSVSYDADNNKFYYTDVDGNKYDIVTLAVIKNALNLSAVATNGSYESLSNKPKINNVTLSGDKTTSDLNISYNDLSDQPSIPTLTERYNSSDTSMAMTGKATSNALQNYTINTRMITGVGALSGGGNLMGDRTITHKSAPTGLTPESLKVAIDEYGHVQIGSPINSYDVSAVSATHNVVTTCSDLDCANYGTIAIILSENDTLSFSTDPIYGRRLRLYFTNTTSNDLTVTVDTTNFSMVEHVFIDGTLLTGSTTLNVRSNSSLSAVVTLVDGIIDGDSIAFCFINTQ